MSVTYVFHSFDYFISIIVSLTFVYGLVASSMKTIKRNYKQLYEKLRGEASNNKGINQYIFSRKCLYQVKNRPVVSQAFFWLATFDFVSFCRHPFEIILVVGVIMVMLNF